MAEEVKGSTAAGWKPDPTGRFVGRFWDGKIWTDHVVSRERVTSIDPMPVKPQPPVRTPRPVDDGGTHVGPPSGWPRWARIAVPVAVVLAVVIAVAVNSGGKKESPAGPGPATGATKALYALGETAPTGDFDVTVHGVRDPQGPGEFLQPQPGMHFVSVDVEVFNRSSRQRSFSSLLGFHLTAGDRDFDTTFAETQPPPPDGLVAPGEALRGFVVFEIPDGTTGLRLRAQGSLNVSPVTFALG